jgi:hypothetical protein
MEEKMKKYKMQLPESFRKGLWQGVGIVVGMLSTSLIAVTVTGVVTWAGGQTLTASDLNATINGLVTAVESIPDWAKNGTSAVYTSGNVGIGTTSPGQNLEIVNGTQAIVRITGGTGSSHYGANSTSGYITTESAIPFRFFTDQIERMRINENGNVGIGTTNPTKKLEVNDGSIRIIPSIGGDNWLELYNRNSSSIAWALNDGAIDRDLRLYRYDSSSTHLDTVLQIENNTGNAVFSHNVHVSGALSKGSGTFDIPHPDGSMPKNSRLRHSFVESPTAGDNIYRWQVRVNKDNGKSYIKLPKYWKHLNTNPMVWVSSVGEVATASGYVDINEDRVVVQADKMGSYNVLVLGTRKDEVAVNNWKRLGMEYIGDGIGSAVKILSYLDKTETGSLDTDIPMSNRKSELEGRTRIDRLEAENVLLKKRLSEFENKMDKIFWKQEAKGKSLVKK